MKWLTNFKKVAFVVIALSFGVISWGQTLSPLNPSGENPGSKENPYVISSVDDWNTFATDETYWDKYIKLSDDWNNASEPITTMAEGDGYTPFSGIFDGNNKTLTINCSDNAPFYYTDGATIKNLIVAGTITATAGYAAGLIYSTTGENGQTTVDNVKVSVIINATEQEYCAGFAVYSAYLTFTNCIYNGTIVSGANSAGFSASYYEPEPATFTNCLFDPADGSSITSGAIFAKYIDLDNSSNYYYTSELNLSEQGKAAYKTTGAIPSNVIGKTVTVCGETFYGKVDVAADIEETYLYDGTTDYYSTVTSCEVTFDGSTATSSSDYTISVTKNDETVTEVIDKGDYTLVITGVNGNNYYGSYSQEFSVVDDLSGTGTQADPYIISSRADWSIFANKVNTGTSYSGQYLKLTADIEVSTMVGTAEHPFKGNFSGREGETYNIHTMTFNYGTTSAPTDNEIVAPFRYTDGATIEYLKVSGAIHTNAGKEAGLIGVNTRTSANTTVQYVIVDIDLYCYESLWDAEGGGFAYDGRGIAFHSSAYQGRLSLNNYHGGFCGKGNNNTSFDNCLFNPEASGMYWAENFVYNKEGSTSSSYYNTCYYTLGNNQETSEQGTLVYVGELPEETIGNKITTLYGKAIYKPVEVVITGVNSTYIYTGEDITVTPAVTFDGTNAISNNYCTTDIDPSPVHDIGTYTLTITGEDADDGHHYFGTKTKYFRVVDGSSEGWNALQTALSGSDATITLDADYIAGVSDAALTIDRDVTIELNGHTIDRGLYNSDPVIGGQVFRISSGVTVTINGPGTITGGNNQAENSTEHGEYNDGGGIYNMGTLILNNVTIEKNKCEKRTADVSRTARGGGIYSGNGSTLEIYGGDINNNEAYGGGGGVFADRAKDFKIDLFTDSKATDTTNVHSNISKDKGGGIRVDATNKTYNVKNCIIKNNNVELHGNQSASFGGGIHLDAGTLNLENCIIILNRSTKYGGGIYMMNGTINAKNCKVMYNASYDSDDYHRGYGGGVCIMGGKYYMDGGIVYGNSSYIENGGGIFVNTNATLGLKGTVFVTGNWKYDDSGVENTSTTNVYLIDKSNKGYITIQEGFGLNSRIGVAKNTASGFDGTFTKDLYANGGTISNMFSDNQDYAIIRKNDEARFDNPGPWDPASTGYEINETYIVNTTIDAGENTITFGEDGCLVIVENGYLTANIDNNTDTRKIVLNGGQLITTSSGVKATAIKSIESAYYYSNQNWYVISSPFNNPNITGGPSGATNLITHDGNGNNEYDLFRFNEAATQTDAQGQLLQWENYRAGHEDFTTLENGRGYLYRNDNNFTITILGTLNVADVTRSLSYSGTNELKGFHLIGNPFSHDIYKNDEYQAEGDKPAINDENLAAGYYRLIQGIGYDPDEWRAEIGYNNPIKPLEGVLVMTTSEHDMTITKTTNAAAEYSSSKRDGSGNDNIMFEVKKGNNSDVAYAMFCESAGLNKIERRNANNPMLYISQDGEDYAIATMNDDVKAFNLNFKAMTMGEYTLSVKPQGEFGYIHLYDKLTGEDIDILLENEYTFIGSNGDNADRFIVRLGTTNGDADYNESFVWQNGNDIIVAGEGELQVFDVMGRMVATQHVNGVQTVEKPSSCGVYIFRLEGKAQKIVIR